MVDSGQIADEDLQRHGADGYLEKPLDSRRLRRLLRDLSSEDRGDHEALLDQSELYREIVEKGLPDQVFLNRNAPDREVAGL